MLTASTWCQEKSKQCEWEEKNTLRKMKSFSNNFRYFLLLNSQRRVQTERCFSFHCPLQNWEYFKIDTWPFLKNFRSKPNWKHLKEKKKFQECTSHYSNSIIGPSFFLVSLLKLCGFCPWQIKSKLDARRSCVTNTLFQLIPPFSNEKKAPKCRKFVAINEHESSDGEY